MKLGLESFSARNSGKDPIGVLELADKLGLEGVLFEFSPFNSFRDDDLAAIRRFADEKNLFVEFGMGSIFRWHPMAEKCLGLLEAAGYDTSASEARIVIDHLDVARKLGSPVLRCVAGNLFSRDEGCDMAKLADDVVAILREACKAAEDLGIKIAMENHADFTVRELLSIRSRVNSPAMCFTMDTANLAFDLDDPVRLARMLAPFTAATHFKNYRVIRTPAGVALANCSLGEGHIDQRAIAAIVAEAHSEVNLNIEIHSQYAPFRLDVLDPTFFDRHVSPPGDGLCWYLNESWRNEIVDPLPADMPDGPDAWSLELEHIEQSIAWARKNLSDILTA